VLCVVAVYGVTQLHDVVYMVGRGSTIFRFNATTHERLTDIRIGGFRVCCRARTSHEFELIDPQDIVACEQTSQLYVADHQRCVWRVSADGVDKERWWSRSSTDEFKPATLSVTSTRLLVTSPDTKQLMQLDSQGNELRRVQLPDHMEPWHAVESPTATFIVSHKNTQLKQYQISEVNMDGQVLRHFTGSRLSPLGLTEHISINSHGNVFVADNHNGRILLLSAQLKLRRVIIDEHQLNYKEPWRLCYRESTGQLLVGLFNDRVAVFDVLCR